MKKKKKEEEEEEKVAVCYADIVPILVVLRLWSAVRRSLMAVLEVFHTDGCYVESSNTSPR
jgi:hypothetical protein